MTTEIAPLAAVQDKIRAKIQAEFVSLIPDEMWSGLVQSVVNDFTRDKTGRNPYEAKEAPIKAMIRTAIEDECKAKISESLMAHRSEFDGLGGRTISDATEVLIREHMPNMLAAMQEASVRLMVDNALRSMRESMGQY